MKLLKISVSGLPLFKGKCEIDFLAMQRVTADNAEKMSTVFSNGKQDFMQNSVLSFVGINASGKTTILKLIAFVCRMLNNEPINSIEYNDIFDELEENQEVVFENFFGNCENTSDVANGDIYLLTTKIMKIKNKLIISEEKLDSKPITKEIKKKSIFDFSFKSHKLWSPRKEIDFLLDDVSIMVAFNKKNKDKILFSDMLKYTNSNELSLSEDCPLELIAFLDPSIEYLKYEINDRDVTICLKFREKKEMILNRFSQLNRYLSSGTIKGINIFLNAMKIFKTGGYLIIDELENHFNHEIVATLIRFFMDKKINPKGAMLIFSTHYAELLDEFERNDNIYVVRNQQGITIENLAEILKRNDIKKSDAYQSGLIGGTTPMYEPYMALKKSIIKSNGEG